MKFCESINYYGAGTVEFLVDESENHVFIEMNPRIQVEHTVTEEVTSVDLVKAQMNILAGASLEDMGLSQDSIQLRGAALQTRITTEDPNNGFRPDTGVITAYRSPGARACVSTGGVPRWRDHRHFDSMLVKMTCRGADFARRSPVPSGPQRVHRLGVATNIGFLRPCCAGRTSRPAHRHVLHRRPPALLAPAGRRRAGRLLDYLADVTVNRPNGSARPISSPPQAAVGRPARRDHR